MSLQSPTARRSVIICESPINWSLLINHIMWSGQNISYRLVHTSLKNSARMKEYNNYLFCFHESVLLTERLTCYYWNKKMIWWADLMQPDESLKNFKHLALWVKTLFSKTKQLGVGKQLIMVPHVKHRLVHLMDFSSIATKHPTREYFLDVVVPDTNPEKTSPWNITRWETIKLVYDYTFLLGRQAVKKSPHATAAGGNIFHGNVACADKDIISGRPGPVWRLVCLLEGLYGQ